MDGECVEAPRDCDDGVACSIDSCDRAAGGCVHDTSACPCSTSADCDDGKPCTEDVCDPATWTCSNPIAPGTPCNDLDPCTVDDACDVAGRCAGVARECDDGNACTADRCDGLTGQCVFEPVSDGTACDDGDACTAGDRCVSGGCTPGYLASFHREYPAYPGPFARVFQAAVRLDDGGYLIADRAYHNGPSEDGIRAVRLSSAGAEVWDEFALAVPGAAGWSGETLGVARIGSYVYMLSNAQFVNRIHVDDGAEPWETWGSEAGGHATIRAMTHVNQSLVLLGHTDGSDLWVGWLNPADGTLVSSVTPPDGAGVRGERLATVVGGFLVAGLVADGSEDDLWLGRLDSAGRRRMAQDVTSRRDSAAGRDPPRRRRHNADRTDHITPPA